MLPCFILLFIQPGRLISQNAGTPDVTFGQSGEVTIGSNLKSYEGGKTVALPDGKLIVAASVKDSFLGKRFLIRLLANGSVDSTFGTNGQNQFNLPTGAGGIGQLLLSPEGKLLMAGQLQNLSGGPAFAARFLADGGLDTSFGQNGMAYLAGGNDGSFIHAVRIKPDGKILLGGTSSFTTPALPGPHPQLLLIQLLPNGTYDPSFGNGGILYFNLAALPDILSLALQSDGKIVAAGSALARFLPNGQLDASFADTGLFTFVAPYQNKRAYGVHVQDDQKIIFGGFSSNYSLAPDSVFLIRLDGQGHYDPDFGTNGAVFTEVDSLGYTYGQFAFQADGKTLVSFANKETVGINTATFRLIRYQNSGAIDSTFAIDGQVQSPAYASDPPTSPVYQSGPLPVDLLLQADGKIVQTFMAGKKIVLWRYDNELMVATHAAAAVGFQLSCSPNPLNEVTQLNWTLKTASPVHCDLYDAQGRRLQTILSSTFLPAGEYQQTVRFNRHLPKGIYFLRFQAGRQNRVLKLLKTND